MIDQEHAEKFYEYVCWRQNALIMKNRKTKPAYLNGKMAKCHLSNVFRDNDPTSIWCRDNIMSRKNVLMGIFAFRMFNTIEAGELLLPVIKAHAETGIWNGDWAAIQMSLCESPFAGHVLRMGALGGFDSLTDSCLHVISEFNHLYRRLVNNWDYQSITLQNTHKVLNKVNGVGPVMAYEMCRDLMTTHMLCKAKDRERFLWVSKQGCKGLSFALKGDENSIKFKDTPKAQKELTKLIIELKNNQLELGWKPDKYKAKPLNLADVHHNLWQYYKYCIYEEPCHLKQYVPTRRKKIKRRKRKMRDED